MSFTIALGLVYQVKQMIPGLVLSVLRAVAVALSTSGCHIAMMIYVSSAWVFPQPFGIVVSVIPFITFFVCYFLLAFGKAQFRSIPNLAQQLQHQVYIVIAQAVLVLVYPIFSAVFSAISPSYQPAFVIVKNVVAWASSHIEEFMPEITVFSVEVFNALYVATCMQTVGSPLTSICIIVFDAFHAIVAFRGIRRRTTTVQRLRHQYNQTKLRLLGTVLDICQQPEVLKDQKFLAAIRLRSPICHKLSARNSMLLENFVRRQSLVGKLSSRPEKPGTPEPRFFGSAVRVVPVTQTVSTSSSCTFFSTTLASRAPTSNPTEDQQRLPLVQVTPLVNLEPAPLSSSEISPVERIELVHETLKLLFHCEYFVLVEYIECTIPLLYATYLSILFDLPNAKYYPHTQTMTESRLDATVINLLVYIWLEVLSFLGLHFVVKWKFGFSPVYLLAFVLENQMQTLQGRLSVWTMYILQFTLQHFGVDFSFKFAWMNTGLGTAVC